jgi:hypothetical protein
MKSLKWSFALKLTCLFLLIPAISLQAASSLKLPKETLKIGADSFYDTKFDYSKFSGRVTDRDATA